MLNQVTRALAALIRPIAASRTAQSSSDRDAMGQAYENLQQNAEENSKQGAEQQPESEPQKEPPTAQVIPLRENTPEVELEARKKAIANSQAWIGLVTELGDRKSGLTEQSGKGAGPGAYEKANSGTSKAARAKKGVILDKKAG